MAKEIYNGKTAAEIAKDLLPVLLEHFPDHFDGDKEKMLDAVRVNVWRWLNKDDYRPNRMYSEALKRAGYDIEPFIFGIERWEELKKEL